MESVRRNFGAGFQFGIRNLPRQNQKSAANLSGILLNLSVLKISDQFLIDFRTQIRGRINPSQNFCGGFRGGIWNPPQSHDGIRNPPQILFEMFFTQFFFRISFSRFLINFWKQICRAIRSPQICGRFCDGIRDSPPQNHFDVLFNRFLCNF